MNHADHVTLLREGVVPGGVWADVGSGRGAFTLALADLLGPAGSIHSVDRDGTALRDQGEAMRRLFPDACIEYRAADFTRPLPLPPLDGVVAANALHFVRDPTPVVRALVERLAPGGHFVLVEYEAEHGNPWVPYPIPYRRWAELAPACGLTGVRRLVYRPGRFMAGCTQRWG